MSDIEKMREEFEAAFAQETARRAALEAEYDPDQIADLTVFVMVRDRRGDTYRQEHFASAWWAWQASRQAVVVELSVNVSGGLYSLALEDCKHCIEAQGLAVRS